MSWLDEIEPWSLILGGFIIGCVVTWAICHFGLGHDVFCTFMFNIGYNIGYQQGYHAAFEEMSAHISAAFWRGIAVGCIATLVTIIAVRYLLKKLGIL